MHSLSVGSRYIVLLAIFAAPAYGSLAAQPQDLFDNDAGTTVYGTPPADLTGLTEGPEIEGFIAARSSDRMRITGADGSSTVIGISEGTEVRARKGPFGFQRSKLDTGSLLNGLPVSVKTVQWNGGLVASEVKFKNNDLKTAAMIQSGTAQGFADQTAATEALRGRMGDIDKYNIKGTTNVHFDTGKWNLSPAGMQELCATATDANAMDNALLLVVGYTDSVGSQEYNQILSERRAGRVVNHLQQECGWKPWRMLTPTGMAESDPLASNDTPEGKAQNRRVSVNILVSKSLDGL